MSKVKSIDPVILSSRILFRSLSIDLEESWKNPSYIFNTLYLAIFLENFVLHDQVAFVTEYEYEFNNELDEIREIFTVDKLKSSRIFAPFAETGLIKFFEEPIGLDIGAFSKTIDSYRPEYYDYIDGGRTDWMLDFYFIGQSLVEMEFAFKRGIPFVPDYSNDCKTALSLLKEKRERQLSLLSNTYYDLSDSFKADIKRLVDAGSDRNIFIPPIPAIILDRAKKPEDICKRAVELRAEFSEIRSTFREYEKKIRDDSLSIGESISAFDELERSINAALPKKSPNLVTKVNEWRDLVDISKLLDGVSTSETGDILKMASGLPLKIAINKFNARRVSYLSTLCRDFMNITNYGSLVERVLKHEITSEHMNYAKTTKYESELKEFIFK